MKRNHLYILILFLLVGVTLSSCSKSESKKSNTEYLTKAVWKYDNDGYDNDKNGTIDVAEPQTQACDKDDLATFNTGGTGVFDEGASKCDVDDPQSFNFEWAFKNNETELEFYGDQYKILSLDDNQLKLYMDFDIGGGLTIRYILALKH